MHEGRRTGAEQDCRSTGVEENRSAGDFELRSFEVQEFWNAGA